MKSLLSFSRLIALVLISGFAGLVVAQQTPGPTDAKQFSKDGLSFNYANGWALEDTSNADAQQFTLSRPDSEAQIRLFVFRTPVTSPERLIEARKVLVDPYVASVVKQFQQMAARPEKTPATTDFGTMKSEGVKVSASLGGEPGAAEIHWIVIGQRMLVLTMFGPDKAIQKAAPAWDTLRNTIAIEEPKPEPKATPKPSPK
jgi:hypothetical protein